MACTEPGCSRGLLVSTEGINGVGKTYLTRALADRCPPARRPLVLEEFSARTDGATDLGRDLLKTLIAAAPGDMFLRGGTPAAEALLLLAIKAHDLDRCMAALGEGRVVIEGRSIDTTAIYQALIMHPNDDDAAAQTARTLLNVAAQWRIPPDLTLLIIDDPRVAIERAQQRGRFVYSAADRTLQQRAARLYTRLAAEEPGRIRVLDRRELDVDAALEQMSAWIAQAQRGAVACPHAPWGRPAGCRGACRFPRRALVSA